jgi:hypothetical protein
VPGYSRLNSNKGTKTLTGRAILGFPAYLRKKEKGSIQDLESTRD